MHTGLSLTESIIQDAVLIIDDEHNVARNMQRIVIINVLYNVIVHQVGHLPRVVPYISRHDVLINAI